MKLTFLFYLAGLAAAIDKLQIGVKHRIPADQCKMKSRKGDKLSMHYTGTLLDGGKRFDSSIGRGPFEFTLGAGQVIQGWDQGLNAMCIGEKRASASLEVRLTSLSATACFRAALLIAAN